MTNTRIKDTLYEDAHLDERGMQDRGGGEAKAVWQPLLRTWHISLFLFFLLVLPASQRRMTIAAHIRFRFSQLGPGTDTHAHTHTHRKGHINLGACTFILITHTVAHAHSHTHTQRSGAVYLCACFFWRSFIILVAVLSHAPLRYAMPHATPTTAHHRIRCSLLSQFS